MRRRNPLTPMRASMTAARGDARPVETGLAAVVSETPREDWSGRIAEMEAESRKQWDAQEQLLLGLLSLPNAREGERPDPRAKD